MEENLIEQVELIREACVEIKANDFAGRNQIGAGFCVAEGYILTCAHVLGMIYQDDQPPKQITFVDNTGKSMPAQFLAADIETDIALIGFEFAEIEPIPLSVDPVSDGESLLCIGTPLGYQDSVSTGIVSNVTGTKESTFLVDMRINPGNSGGLVFSLTQGAAVGIASAVVYAAGQVKSSGMGVVINTETIKPFLDKNGVPYIEL